MRIFIQEKPDVLTCPGCMNDWLWEACDLEADEHNPDMLYVVCPCCKERMYLKRNQSIDNLYKEYNGSLSNESN